ncbi:flavin-containing amine oxidoreductase-domain containing protein [Chytriomyces sp. MP71]|nr:flavin-containing amine oxidoreductase-domain containing protein [Chytriomyces sp. MP71]
MMEVSDNIVASPEALIREEKLSDEEEVSMRDWLLSDAEFDKDVTGCTEYGDLLIDLVSMLENVEGADLNVISLANDDKNDFTGPHLYVADGLWDLVRVTAGSLLKENRDILKLEHEVVGIDYSGEASTPTHPIHIHTSRGVFACKATIITLPLGILQTSHTRLFHPSLPPKHAQAIESVGVGLMDKVILEFPHPFWDPSLDGFWAFLPAPRIRRGMDFDEGGEAAGLVWFVNLCKMHEKGPPVLIGHVSQRHARRIEEMDDEEVEALFMEMLKACFVGVQVPEPESFRVTRWGMDPFSMGACAYLPVGNGASLANIITLSEPVSSVHFAGEHTSPHHFGTVHGALMSGIVEAESVALELGFLQ